MLQAPDKLDDRVRVQPGCDHGGRSFAAKRLQRTRHPARGCIKIAAIQPLRCVEYFQVAVVLIEGQGGHLMARSASAISQAGHLAVPSSNYRRLFGDYPLPIAM